MPVNTATRRQKNEREKLLKEGQIICEKALLPASKAYTGHKPTIGKPFKL